MFSKIKFGSCLDWILKIWGICTIIWGMLSYFDIMPFYQIKLYKVNSLTPLIYLFPASKIRLNLDFHEATSMQDVNSATWQLLKNNEVLFNTLGLQPTITLPATEGGIYQLRVTTIMADSKKKTGQINFYVVQDNPKKITIPSPAQVNLTTNNNTPEFLQSVKNNGAEIYTEDGKWEKVENISASGNNVTLDLKPNQKVSSFGGQMLIRAQGRTNNLENYGAAQIPFK